MKEEVGNIGVVPLKIVEVLVRKLEGAQVSHLLHCESALHGLWFQIYVVVIGNIVVQIVAQRARQRHDEVLQAEDHVVLQS